MWVAALKPMEIEDHASIGTGPDCCHGASIVPQHVALAQQPPVKMSMLWSVSALSVCVVFFFTPYGII